MPPQSLRSLVYGLCRELARRLHVPARCRRAYTDGARQRHDLETVHLLPLMPTHTISHPSHHQHAPYVHHPSHPRAPLLCDHPRRGRRRAMQRKSLSGGRRKSSSVFAVVEGPSSCKRLPVWRRAPFQLALVLVVLGGIYWERDEVCNVCVCACARARTCTCMCSHSHVCMRVCACV